MRGSHSNSPPPASPSPGLVGVRGGRAYFALPNLIQQRSSAFAMGVGKLQQPAEPVSVFPHVTPQLAGECRVIQCAFDSLHLSVRPFRVIWEARDEVA